MKNNKRKIMFIGGALAVIFFSMFFMFNAFGSPVKGQSPSYYSGDAIVYGNNIVITSVNSGLLEIFSYDGKDIVRRNIISVPYGEGEKIFFDSALRVADNHLYVYAVNGRYLFKYDISNLSQPVLDNKVKKTNWDWFMRVQNISSGIVTIGTKGLSLWSDQGQIINGYKNPHKHAFINISDDGRYVFDFNTNYDNDDENDFVSIVDNETRSEIWNGQIVLNKEINRDPYVDSLQHFAYIPGDRVLKQINLLNGDVKNFKHISNESFAVDSLPGKDYVYFSDGKGIVKLDSSLAVLKSLPIGQFNIPLSWSIQIKALSFGNSDRVVVFNNSNISIVDDNLNVLSSYQALTDDKLLANTKNSVEDLAISLDRYNAKPAHQLSVSGAGFGFGEEITLTFMKDGEIIGRKFTTYADSDGHFHTSVITPSDLPLKLIPKLPAAIDVRAEGIASKRHISTSVMMEE